MDQKTSICTFKEKPETLEEFIQFYKMFGYDDITIVKFWAEANHLETELSNMAIQLTASKLDQERRKLYEARMIIGSFNSFGQMQHNINYTPEQESLINAWLTQLALYEELTEHTMDEIRRLAPTMPAPHACYRSLIYYINKVIGVRFADQEKDEEGLGDSICQKVDAIVNARAKAFADEDGDHHVGE